MKIKGCYHFMLLLVIQVWVLAGCSTELPRKTNAIEDVKKEDLKPSDAALSPAELAFQKMKDWQIEYVKENNLMNNSTITHYPEQEGMLAEYGYSRLETPEEAALLDQYHEVYGWWYLMRENMTVLYTQKCNDIQYSVVITIGDEGSSGVHVVSYHIVNGKIIIKGHVTGDIPLSSGFCPNLRDLNGEAVFFGIIQGTRYDAVNDKRVPSDFTKLVITLSDGNIESHSLRDDTSVVLLFYSETSKPVSCRLLDSQGEEVENYQLELDAG